MPRTARVDIANYPYHVINRAVMRLEIFDKASEYQQFQELLEKSLEETDMQLLAYVIMSNHWHLLLYPKKDGDLGRFMHHLTNAHTRKVKSQTKTIGTGPLYQGRYKSFVIQDDTHLLTVLKYIERNPVRAGVVKKVQDWRWGSAWERIHNSKSFLSESPTRLPKDYIQWVNTPEQSELLSTIRSSVNKGRPYGGDKWIDMTVKQFGLEQTLRSPGRPRKS